MSNSYLAGPGDIIHLNVGGERFSTSKQTLSWMPDTFFTSLLSGRISTLKDDTGAIFIDRDPALFRWILQYLRTREIATKGYDINELKHEAEFYGVSGLVKRLSLCQDLESSSCGDVLFCGYLPPPSVPLHETAAAPSRPAPSRLPHAHPRLQGSGCCEGGGAPGTGRPVDSVPNQPSPDAEYRRSSHPLTHHSRNSSADLNKLFKIEIGVLNNIGGTGSCWVDPLRVRMVKAHHNWVVVGYAHFVTCYRNKDSTGWQLAFTSPHQDQLIERVAINAKMTAAGQQQAEANAGPHHNKMVAIAYGANIRLWAVGDDGSKIDVGTFHLGVSVEYLFFIGYQLVGLSSVGKIGVWHAMTRNWQTQDVLPVASFDTAGSFLLLGCTNGSIYYIDMQKFPLRMKDNDLLVTELYHDPSNDVITAISVYLTPKTNVCGNWIEIAYGTSSGTVRVIVQHPETVGHGPQLFQTFTVHRHPVTKVRLSEKLLMSVCSEYNHVRTWSVMRFRGMISTQPGSTPLSSYKILTLEEADQPALCVPHANEIGPYGEQDDEQVFIQKVLPETDQLIVRLASKGKRVCEVKSVDGSSISGFCVHECDGRIGSTRPRRYLFTGHTSGAIQMWDLTTALDMINKPEPPEDGSPAPSELLRMLESCELSYSYGTTPCVSPSPHHPHASHHTTAYHPASHHHTTASHHTPATAVHVHPAPPQQLHHTLSQQPGGAGSAVPSHYPSAGHHRTYSNGGLSHLPLPSEPSLSSQQQQYQQQQLLNKATTNCRPEPSSHTCSTNSNLQFVPSTGCEATLVNSSASVASSSMLADYSKLGTMSGTKNSQSSSPPHRPHLSTQSRLVSETACKCKPHSNNCRPALGGSGGACLEQPSASSTRASVDSSTPAGVGVQASCSRSSYCSSVGDAAAGSGCSSVRGAPPTLAPNMSQLLKPANVAFLSHNQSPARKDDKHDEGTPC